MKGLPTRLISKLNTTSIRFQIEIINRLKLFDFSKSAILYYSESQEKCFEGYPFDNLQSRFKLIEFKKGHQIKSIEYKDMVIVGNSYIKGELSDSIFVLNMATFEHWILWVLKTLILSNPREFYPKNKKQIDVNDLKTFSDMPMLWDKLVDDYLGTLSYQGMKTLLKTFLRCFALKESDITPNLIGMINENSQCRNVIMHNKKKVNATYTNKCGKYAKFAQGDSVIITEDLLFGQADNLLRFMQDFRHSHSPTGTP